MGSDKGTLQAHSCVVATKAIHQMVVSRSLNLQDDSLNIPDGPNGPKATAVAWKLLGLPQECGMNRCCTEGLCKTQKIKSRAGWKTVCRAVCLASCVLVASSSGMT